MKLSTLLISLLLLIPNIASAEENFDLKIHLRQQLTSATNDVSSENNIGKATKFEATYLKMNLTGKLADDIRFRFRHAFNDPTTTTADGTGSTTDYAYIDKVYGDTFIRMGKQFYGGLCGRDGDASSLRIQFFGEACNVVPDFYLNGISAYHSVADQLFALALVNPSTIETNSSGVGISASYWGNFMGGMIEPIVNYTTLPTNEQKDANGTVTSDGEATTHWAAGSRFTFGKVWFELDVEQTIIPDRTVGGSADTEVNSQVVSLQYAPGALKYEVKYSLSDIKNSSAIDTDFNSATATVAGLEYDQTQASATIYYTPNADVDLTYHIAYYTRTRDFKGASVATADTTDSKIMVGFNLTYSSKK